MLYTLSKLDPITNEFDGLYYLWDDIEDIQNAHLEAENKLRFNKPANIMIFHFGNRIVETYETENGRRITVPYELEEYP